MLSDNNQEMFPVVDEQGNITGAATRGECHSGSKLLHPVVHLHIFNTRGELYLQKRPEWKDIQPGKWDTAVGGHIDLGESVEIALKREVREELGITDFIPELLTNYVFESEREKELVFVHKTVYDGEIHPSEELDGGRFWTIEEIKENLGKGIFTPNFESELQKVSGRGKAHPVSVLINHEFLEIPLNRRIFFTIQFLLCQPLIKGSDFFPFDGNLSHHRESYIVIQRTELSYLLITSGLLPHKVICRETDYYKVFIFIFLIQFLQLSILWRQSALRSYVDHKHFLTFQ